MLFSPKPYQAGARDFAMGTPRCYLDASIGSGKTAISLSVASELILRMEVRRVLVIAPLNVVLNTFPDEMEKWDHTEGYTYEILHGNKKEENLMKDVDFHFLNYEGLEWFFHNPNRPWYDMIIMDEAHWIKDGTTRRFRYARTVLADVPRVIMMSGTPIGNSLLDLWSQYYLLDKGLRLYASYEQYRSSYFEQTDYMGYKWEAYDWSETAIVKAVSDITYQVHADDVVLTELTEVTLECEMPPEDLERYKRFERDYFVEIDEVEIEAFNAAALATKLRQFANGFLYHDGDDTANRREVTRMHDVKLEYLRALVDDADENIMIVATFQEDFAVLGRYFPGLPCIYGKTAKGLVRKRIQAWNKGEFKVMAIHPRSVGIGLNLQEGGCRQIWMSPDWSYLSKLQTVGRLHRMGQEKDVLVEVLVAKDTIDEMVMEALKDKKMTATGFASKLKAYKRYVLGRS